MSTCSSIGKVDSPITVGPVVRVGGAAFWVAAIAALLMQSVSTCER